MSLGFVNTVLNTIVAEAIDDLAEDLDNALQGGKSLAEAVTEVVRASYETNRPIVFDGDGYSEEWHAEAERRGLMNLRTTPDALPWLINPQTTAVFSNYNVLSEREMHARYDVFIEQYAVKLNIEAETAASIARTMILPAAVRHLALLKGAGVEAAAAETQALIDELWDTIAALEQVNLSDNQPDGEPMEWATYMRDKVIPAMDGVRTVADRLERIVADDLWPLPKYSEMLFIK
jgi:glutamine synthetase